MQTSVPELMDISKESKQTLELYGAEPGKASFANNCLLRARLVERGVRMVQLYDADWDHHADLATRLPRKCQDVDRGMAALIRTSNSAGCSRHAGDLGREFGARPCRKSTPAAATRRSTGAIITRTPSRCGSPAAA
jgi:hypothetical protein